MYLNTNYSIELLHITVLLMNPPFARLASEFQLLHLQLGYIGGAVAMVVASTNNIVLTVAYVLSYQLVPRTWGRLTTEALKVCLLDAMSALVRKLYEGSLFP